MTELDYETELEQWCDDHAVTRDLCGCRWEPPRGHTWARRDLGAVFDAGYAPPTPTIGYRVDGPAMFYRGKQHQIYAETEAGKTWLAYAVILQCITAGHGALILDFEDTEATAASRLSAMGATRAQLSDLVAFIAPDEPLKSGNGIANLEAAAHDVAAAFVFLDGLTEAMTIHGLDPLSNGDVARFGRILPRRLANLPSDPAVLTADHVVKNADNRGRYAMGGIHKTNVIDGASYRLDNRTTIRPGAVGRSTIYVTKDRSGGVRANALNSKAGQWFADLVVDSSTPGFLEVALAAPTVSRNEAGAFRPTANMAKVAEVIKEHSGRLGVNDIAARLPIRASDLRTALAALEDDGYIAVVEGARGKRLHTHVRDYGSSNDESGDPLARLSARLDGIEVAS